MDCLIFDMDGVLIDVSGSYRKTIQQTVEIYLRTCLGFKGTARNLVTNDEISLFKAVGGFNNDWDLTAGVLLHLLSISGLPPLPKHRRFASMNETLFYLQKRSSEFNREVQDLATRKDFQRFLKRVQTSGGGLRGIRKVQGGAWDGWVYRKGEIDQENVVKRIFQEIYLGDQFPSLYGFGPLFHKGEGLYLHERLLISRTVLGALRRKVRMGIASGRPRFEAELALRRFGLIPYFKSVVTLDECHKEEERAKRSTGKRSKRTKPHPYSILRVIREIGIPSPRCAYVGDVVDDMVAARRAREKVEILAIGFAPGGKKDRTAEESLRKAGADMVVRNPQELLQVVERL